MGDTWYNALQVKGTKRLSHGLTLVSTFAWQKTLDDRHRTGPESRAPRATL